MLRVLAVSDRRGRRTPRAEPAGPAQACLRTLPASRGTPPPLCRHYKNPAHQRRVRGAWAATGDCDLLLFLVDAARELQRADPRIARLLADSASHQRLGMPDDWHPPPAVLVLNKVVCEGRVAGCCAGCLWAARRRRPGAQQGA